MTIKINTEDNIKEANEIIEKEDLVPAKEQYIVNEDPEFPHSTIGRWNFKKRDTEDIEVFLHLVYSPRKADKVRQEIKYVI